MHSRLTRLYKVAALLTATAVFGQTPPPQQFAPANSDKDKATGTSQRIRLVSKGAGSVILQ